MDPHMLTQTEYKSMYSGTTTDKKYSRTVRNAEDRTTLTML